MKQTEKQWLKNLPWQRVLDFNQNFCQVQKTSHQIREPRADQARQLWERSVSQEMDLVDAIQVCRRCCEIAPFEFSNASTFAAAGRTILEEWLNKLPPVEAQIARTTITRYVSDEMVTKRELQQVLRQFDARWKINGFDHQLPANLPVPQPSAQVQPAVPQAQCPTT